MKNSEVAEEFYWGSKKSEGSHMYVEGNILYSYGSHFPMAVRLKEGFLWNPDKYSQSTSSHQSCVKSYIGKEILAEFPTQELIKLIINLNLKDELKSIDDVVGELI